MAKKQFKTESKKLLDMMINSIYTHKEIFLRELISNASDAIDKLYFKSLTDQKITLKHDDYVIRLAINKDARTITITDNGCGMTMDELEKNLGTIAKSGSFDFKKDSNNETDDENVDIIGQFGVGFYSAFMVCDNVVVETRAYDSDSAARFVSSGVDGYTVEECEKDTTGTVITLHIKADTEEERYTEFLEEYRIKGLVKKYSDYIRYPIKMMCEHSHLKEGTEDEYETVHEEETLNSMIPIWKKAQNEVTDEEYATFYRDKFYDFNEPLKVIRQKAEGTSEYIALMFIPSKAPMNYYSRDFEKGLQLYSSGVMIMENCNDLLPEYFSFVRGLVDSSDLSLNISREMLQHDRQLKIIAKALEKKISSELTKMLEQERDKYEEFFKAFGVQLKYGVYSDYGMHKEVLQDLLMFKSSFENKNVTLKEYVSRMSEGQDKIYFASGESAEKIAMLPQVESVIAKGYEVLFLSDDVDEFALQMLMKYDEKEFSNVCNDNLDLSTDEEKEKLKNENEGNAELLKFMQESIGDKVKSVKFTNALKNHPVCLSNEGALSMEMEKVLNQMPGAETNGIKAEVVLEINTEHQIAEKIKKLYADGEKDKLGEYAKVLYAQARLISGYSLDNPTEIADLVCKFLLD